MQVDEVNLVETSQGINELFEDSIQELIVRVLIEHKRSEQEASLLSLYPPSNTREKEDAAASVRNSPFSLSSSPLTLWLRRRQQQQSKLLLPGFPT